MGWNSWDSGIDLTEQNVKDTIDAMVSSGMRDAGYRYVNLDAGWAATARGSDGHLHPDAARFPDGIAAVARYAHDRGMLLGIYASPYNEGCSAQPALASAGHETSDAQTFAEWGVDYLKYDWCRSDANHDTQVRIFSRMRDALRATGRRILYSINPNSSSDYTAGVRYDWSGIADMARVSTDLVPVWKDQLPSLGPLDPFALRTYLGVADQFAAATSALVHSRPGFWSDADMAVVGLGWSDFATRHFSGIRNGLELGNSMSDDQLLHLLLQQPNLTDTEQRTHLSLWAMLSAPLIVGTDIRSMSPQTRDILTNREVLAIDQDPKVASAATLRNDPRVLVKPLADGAVAVAFMALGDSGASITTTAEDIGTPKAPCYTVRDLWAHTDSTTEGAIASGALAPHSVAVLRVTAACK
ncbi:MAG: glycoside hydrolase family 27 protein [Mycobacteriaceae bacterium]|nr:glycoside hydrolase family 27 protein [Mycobacteriaceae bacterium]